MKPKILVTRKISDIAEKNLKEKFDVTLNLKDEAIPYENLAKTCNEYDGVIAASWDKFDSNFFNEMNGKLKIIASIAVGYDNIDIDAAKNKKRMQQSSYVHTECRKNLCMISKMSYDFVLIKKCLCPLHSKGP